MKRFLPLLIPIIGLLIAIPCLLIAEMVFPAKIAGVILVLLTWLSLRIWLRNALKKKLSENAVKFNVNHRYYLDEISPIYRYMSKAEKKVLEKRMGKLIADLQFDDTSRNDLDSDDILAYALLQILVVYEQEYKPLKGKMIVFDQADSTGELKISEEKYILLNPVFIKNVLKETPSVEAIRTSQAPIVAQLKQLYLKA